MRKLIISFVLASASLVPSVALAQAEASSKAAMSDLQADAPSEYTVQRGDTLWGISGRFLKEPWKWPQIWQMNRDQIKNPHLIYPGDIIKLDKTGGVPKLSVEPGSEAQGNVVKLQPRTRIESLSTAIPTIPGSALAPFLTQPLIVESGGLEALPKIVATEEERVVIGVGNIAYVDGLKANGGNNWQVFRSGDALIDPQSGELLGYEAIHVGDARVKRFGDPSTIEITRAKQEINENDRLTPMRESSLPSYAPRAPDKPITGAIMSVRGGVVDFAQYSIVTINRGSRDGVEVGHVLATMRKGGVLHKTRSGRPPLIDDLMVGATLEPNPVIPDTVVAGAPPAATSSTGIVLPDERSGLLLIFRTFEKLSYGMILKSVRPISVGDVVQTP